MSNSMSAIGANPNWVLISKFGESQIFIENSSIIRDGAKYQALVKYVLVPYGKDKRNGKSVKQMIFHEEYDIEIMQHRIYQIIFFYADGTVADPLTTDLKWVPASDGSAKILEYFKKLNK